MKDPAIERLILDHVGLAQVIAAKVWQTAKYALELPELTSIAYLGLVQAANRWPEYCAKSGFDPSKEQFFVTFAYRRIYGSVMDALRRDDHSSRRVRDNLKVLREHGFDDGASEDAMVASSGLSREEVRDVRVMQVTAPVSLEFSTTKADGTEGNNVANRLFVYEQTEEHLSGTAMLQDVVATITSLTPQHQVVLALHYYKEVQIADIAVLMGLTETRASHLHTQGVLAVRAGLLKQINGDSLPAPKKAASPKNLLG